LELRGRRTELIVGRLTVELHLRRYELGDLVRGRVTVRVRAEVN
tara:strand:- start:345 stop:476 length:132 start_codon:yes stop_codon:yes gene_type:complete